MQEDRPRASSMETPFSGPRLTPEDKVRLTEHHGLAESLFREAGLDSKGTFTIKSVELKHRPSSGEHDDMGPYDYQVVILKELSLSASNDRFELVKS